MIGDPRDYPGPEPQGLTLHAVNPGIRYTLRNGDGSAVCGWAPTRRRARMLAQEAGA